MDETEASWKQGQDISTAPWWLAAVQVKSDSSMLADGTWLKLNNQIYFT